MEAVDKAAVAVIADIVGSRKLKHRAVAQKIILEVFDAVLPHVRVLERPHETIGDEFQAVFPTKADALIFTTLVSISLREGIELRFGMGSGLPRAVTLSGLQDGPGWWAARSAIDEASKRQRGRFPTTRSWFHDGWREAHDSVEHRLVLQEEALTNAYLSDRDATIARLGVRERAWVLSLFEGRSQRDLAASSGLSQPAVSQALNRLGGIQLLEGMRLLKGTLS